MTVHVRFDNVSPGRADVLAIIRHPGAPATFRRVGSVYRLDGVHRKWVPLTPDQEGHADPPEFPRYANRWEAARALASCCVSQHPTKEGEQ